MFSPVSKMDEVIERAQTPPTATTSQTSPVVSPTLPRSEESPQHLVASLTVSESAGQLGTSHNAPSAPQKITKAKPPGKGYGLIDWIRFCRTHKDLPGTGGKHLEVSEAELAKHNTPDDAWTAIRGKVYNITPYLKFHPGGAAELMRAMGKNCTALFDEVHKSVNVDSMLSKCVVGTLLPPPINKKRRKSSMQMSVLRYLTDIDGKIQISLEGPSTEVHCCTVETIQEVTHDVKLYTVKLPTGSSFTVPTGHHVAIRANIDGENIERSYTPVLPLTGTHTDDRNAVQLMIKLYKDGKMSKHLSSLKLGDEVMVSDPEGIFDASRLKSFTNVLLVAAGTGFTPMVKVIRDILSQEDNKRTTKLLFANKKEKDIPWRTELDQLAQSSEGFEITNILSAPDSSWEGLRGRINGNMLREHLPSTSTDKDTLICICGPTPFTAGISNALLDMEFPDECIHCFT